jgi:hypothetical protein
MTEIPLVRPAMLALTLVMVAVMGYRILCAKQPRSLRIASGLSIIVTPGLVTWTIIQFGL